MLKTEELAWANPAVGTTCEQRMLAYKHLYHITAHSFYNLMTEGREFRLSVRGV